MPIVVLMATTITRTTAVTGTGDARAPWRVLPILLLGTFVGQAGYFVVNVALPAIGTALRADGAMVQLVVAAYNVSFAGMLVAAGRLGDRFGRRRLLVVGLVAYGAANVAAGLAFDGWSLTAARLATGVSAALIVPQVLGTIQTTFSGADRQRAIGYFAAAAGVACVLGQLLGGVGVWIDARHGWRGLFLAFALFASLVAGLAHRRVPESTGAASGIDTTGAVMLTVALAGVLVPLSVGRGAGWPLWCWICLVLGLAAGVGFLRHQAWRERTGGTPLLPPSLFAIPAFRRGLATAMLFFVGTGGFFLTSGITLQSGLGMTAIGSALALAPYALAFLVVSLLVPRLVARFGGGQVVVAGALLLALTYGVLTAQVWLTYDRMGAVALASTLTVLGAAQALVMVPVVGTVLAQLPPDRAGLAAGVFSTAQQAGIALGVGFLGTVFFWWASGPVRGDGWRDGTLWVFAAEAGLALLTALSAHRISRALRSGRERDQ